MKQSLLFTLQIAGHLAYMVVLPLFAFGGVGLLLDRHFDTLPDFLLVGIGLALATTIYWMSRKLREIIEASTKEMVSSKGKQ